jgi:putative ABC transport system permease protein
MHLLQDIRLAIRRIRANPLFAATVAGTLAVGIGATTAMYTVVDGVLLKPLPFPRSHELVRVSADYVGTSLRDVGISLPELEDYAERSGVFESISGLWPITANLTGSERPERVEVLLTSPNYFEILGALPQIGRTFTGADYRPGIAAVAVISDAIWKRGFGADPHVLGRTLRIDEDVYEIIGVMPAAFRHPSVTLETDVEVWAASGWKAEPFPPPARGAKFIQSAVGRLKPGMTVDEARARLEILSRELAREYPDVYPERLNWTPRVRALDADLVAGVRPALLVLMGAIGFVLIIAITNISNLLLARAAAREHEIAMQRALGAGRGRILTSLLVEGLVLAILGGVAGLLLSVWGVDLLLRIVPDRLPRAQDIQVDVRVVLFCAAISCAAGLLAGLAPAIQASRVDLLARLKESGRGRQGGARARLVRNALVVAQVALAVVLLAGAGLLARSLFNLQRLDTGVAIDRLLTARVWLPQPNDPASGPYFQHPRRVVLIRNVVERLRQAPGVAHAGMSTALPLTRDGITANFAAEGWPPDGRDLATASVAAVTPGYFPAVGLRLVSGRLLQDSDDERTVRVVTVNESFARAYSGGADPVGRRFRFLGQRGQISANAPWLTIVGVVSDVKEDGVAAPVRPQIYQSLWQVSNLNLAIVASGGDAVPDASAVQTALQESDPNLPAYALRNGADLIATELAQRRFAGTLIHVFAATALFLAALGLHGVIAYTIRQRTHEIGVRMALGASAMHVLSLVLLQSARLTAVGVVIGVAASIAATRLLATLLFGVSPRDPWTLGAASLLLVAVAAIATVAAGRRAIRIDAAAALREGL